jgi:hypothetical protein
MNLHYRFGFCWGVVLSVIVSLAHGASSKEGTAENVSTKSPRATLSVEGSGRATAYPEQNKIITVGTKTHVVWLDAVAEGFRVRGRTLDRTSGKWSEVTTIGEAQDNHGGPALTVDSKGFLHVVFYPHHQAVHYRRSLQPNDLSQWTEEETFGEGLSYPSLLCAPDDTLVVAARRGFFGENGKYLDDHYLEEELWVKHPGSAWEKQSVLMRGRFPRYAQFASGLAWSPDRKTLHLAGRIYESSPDKLGKPAYTVVYMKSADLGKTWTKADGRALELPVSAETIDVLVADDPGIGLQLNSGPVAVDRAGVPHVIYTAKAQGRSQLFLATPNTGGSWTKRDLAEMLPPAVQGWEVNLGMGGGMSISDSGRATIVAVVLAPPPEDVGTPKEWGHPTTEVVRLWSDDGLKTFHSEVLAPMDPREPHWLVNIERPTGHNQVPELPGIIFTGGVAGAGLKDLMLSNRVYWQPAN